MHTQRYRSDRPRWDRCVRIRVCICRSTVCASKGLPVIYQEALIILEREKRFELSTSTLARLHALVSRSYEPFRICKLAEKNDQTRFLSLLLVSPDATRCVCTEQRVECAHRGKPFLVVTGRAEPFRDCRVRRRKPTMARAPQPLRSQGRNGLRSQP